MARAFPLQNGNDVAVCGAETQPQIGIPLPRRCVGFITRAPFKDVDPLTYLTDVLTRIVNGHTNRDIDQLLPWAYRAQALKAVA